MGSWQRLGAMDPHRLIDVRLQLHWAAQAAAAVGKQLLEHQADYGEQSFQWIDGAGALAQGVVSAPRLFRAALRLADPALQLLDAEGHEIRGFPLDGRTLDEAWGWLEEEIPRLLDLPLERPLERSQALEPHAVGDGGRFALTDREACAELAHWFGNAHRLLSGVVARHTGASAVRCWPHHFDLATLITLDPGHDAESARSIGIGLSPGDAGRTLPYLYVTPWPYPEKPALPELEGGGTWNTEGWLGGVLEAEALLGAPHPEEQEDRVERFVKSAIAACRRLIGAV